MRRLPRHATTVLAALLALAAAAPARAADPAPARALQQQLLDRWHAWQGPDGDVYDPKLRKWGVRYAQATLAYGWLHHGLSTGDQAAIAAAMRSFGWVAARPWGTSGPGRLAQLQWPSVFENSAMAAGYNLARAHLAGDPRFEAVRPQWEEMLRQVRPVYIDNHVGFGNKYLVEAHAIAELYRTGLVSPHPYTVLSDREGSWQKVLHLVNVRIPAIAARTTVGGRTLLSDPPRQPYAYHALALAHLARIHDLAPPGSLDPTVMRRMARMSVALQAPDGDVAYVGRSQEQSWALAFHAFGVLRAMDGPAASASVALALRRLQVAHGFGRHGLNLVPAERLAGGAGWLDFYAHVSPYNGLTAMALAWAADALQAEASVPAGPAARPRTTVADVPHAGFAIRRTPRVWFHVRRRIGHGDDSRYDAGLMAIKQLRGGVWRDLVPLRPYVPGQTAAPVLLRDGVRAEMAGTAIRARRGAVIVTGAYRTDRGRGARVRAARWTYEAVGREVLLTTRLRRGERVQMTYHLRPEGLRVGRAEVGDRVYRARANVPGVPVGGPVPVDSVSHGRVQAVTVEYAMPRTGPFRLRYG